MHGILIAPLIDHFLIKRWPRIGFVCHTFSHNPVSFPLWWHMHILTRRVLHVEPELHTLPEHLGSPPVCVGFVLLHFNLCIVFCRSLFVLLPFFLWSLCYMSFFDLRILIIPLVSSNSSWMRKGPDCDYAKWNISVVIS